MSLIDFAVLLAVAGLCGALGQMISGYSRGGCLVTIAIGFIGAVIGKWLAQKLGLSEILAIKIGSEPFPIIWTIIGSALFVAIIGLLSTSKRKK